REQNEREGLRRRNDRQLSPVQAAEILEQSEPRRALARPRVAQQPAHGEANDEIDRREQQPDHQPAQRGRTRRRIPRRLLAAERAPHGLAVFAPPPAPSSSSSSGWAASPSMPSSI